MRRGLGVPHSDIIQLNWLFDIFLVRPHVAAECATAGITGASWQEIVIHSSGQVVNDLLQLATPVALARVRLGELQPVTCQPHNEEGEWPVFATEPMRYCGEIKYHPPTHLVIDDRSLAAGPDVVQTMEWFGSGASAFRLTLVSARFAELVRRLKWRGAELQPVATAGVSTRAV